MTPRGLSATAAAEYVGISATKFRQLVVDGRMPQHRIRQAVYRCRVR